MEVQEMSLDDYIAIMKRRKWSLLLPMITVSIAAIIVALLLPPAYKSTAKILIEEQEIPADFVMSSVTSYAEQRLQFINQKIMSYSRLLDIINRFNLYTDQREKRTTEEIVDTMRKAIAMEQINADVINPRTGRSGNATIAFTLSYESNNPQQSQQVTNALVSFFLEENLKVREKQALSTTEFLEGEMNRIRSEIVELEAKLSRFKEQHANELPELVQVNLQGLQSIELALERLYEQQRSLKEKEGYLQSQLASTSPYIAVAGGNKQLESLKSQLAFLESRYSDKYPELIKTRAQIAELEEQKKEQVPGDGVVTKQPDNPAYLALTSQLETMAIEIKSSKRQIDKLEQKAAAFRARMETMPKVEEVLRNLVLQRDTLQAKYNDLSSKLMESKVAYELEKEQKGERFTLIDPPRLPEKPYKPNRLAIMLIGLVLGIGAGVGTAALREFSDNTVHKAEDLVRATSIPVLVSIPEIVTKKDLTRLRTKRFAVAAGVVLLVAGGLFASHYYVMDLSVLLAKITRKIGI
jgi:succinoglycan biosynthesis transport protein ExoP